MNVGLVLVKVCRVPELAKVAFVNATAGVVVAVEHWNSTSLSGPEGFFRGTKAWFVNGFTASDVGFCPVEFWLIMAFGTGVGFIAYIVGWIAMPKDYGEQVPAVMAGGKFGGISRV